MVVATVVGSGRIVAAAAVAAVDTDEDIHIPVGIS
jgi:hypothetical protein